MCLKTCVSFRFPNIIFPPFFSSSPFLPFEHKQNPKNIASSPWWKWKHKGHTKTKQTCIYFSSLQTSWHKIIWAQVCVQKWILCPIESQCNFFKCKFTSWLTCIIEAWIFVCVLEILLLIKHFSHLCFHS